MTNCNKCNINLEIKKGDFEHIIFGKKILLRNIPYTNCVNCDDMNYISEIIVSSKLKEAYRKNLDIFDYE